MSRVTAFSPLNISCPLGDATEAGKGTTETLAIATGTGLRAPVAVGQATATSPAAARVVRAVPEEATETAAAQTAGITGTMIEETAIGVGEMNATVTTTTHGPDLEKMTSAIVQGREAPPHRASLKCLRRKGMHRAQVGSLQAQVNFADVFLESAPSKRLNLDPDAPDDPNEEGEEMDDEAGMMAMMGMSGFGSTKGKHIDGNQEGAASVKKQRTWRQYMNRRGGFNRPLDKIK
ncbi:hypothetical protein B0H19DRAFT_1379694 [Mycena capillaripes]|nr:hypothetical protein B0H19DRAFT_1379694 [Mycena capillaripes]